MLDWSVGYIVSCLDINFLCVGKIYKKDYGGDEPLRKELEKRFFYLWTGGPMALISFILLSIYVNHSYPLLKLYSLYSFWISFFLLEFLLVQGSIYWMSSKLNFIKERRNRYETPVGIVKKLRTLKKWNIGLMIISPFLFAIDFFKWYSTTC